MSAAICPYCRAPILADENNELLCSGCSTPHHADCFAENGGCTVFGCGAAPPEEPRLRLTGNELSAAAGNAPGRPSGQPFSAGLTTADRPTGPSPRVKAPPPPPPGGAARQESMPRPTYGVGSVLFGSQPVPPVPVAAAPRPAAPVSFEPDPEAKNRMTFIILGVLLGAFGAHNFYAGYKKKAVGQLCLTAFSVGFASPMSWAWAVIDVSTVDRDSNGVKFRS